MTIPEDFQLKSYWFDLPETQIAQSPAQQRDGSRLFVLNRATQAMQTMQFTDLPDILPKNALVIANNSKVVPARMFGTRPTGGKVEFLPLTPLPCLDIEEEMAAGAGWYQAELTGLLRASKRMKPGDMVSFDAGMYLDVLEVGEFGQCKVLLHWLGDLTGLFRDQGHLPLPPYIKRPDGEADRDRYQTTYARNDKEGSVAAPTAGLHFTPAIRERMAAQGMEWAEVTLYVGYGTFSPVRTNDIRDHAMHPEYVEIPEATAQAIQQAKAQGRPVVAIGTTTVRTLEGVQAATGSLEPFAGWINCFMYPGYQFQVVDHMVTNFHLPESSLIMMISAFAGRKTILDAYDRAITEDFRFFSYGDSMCIL